MFKADNTASGGAGWGAAIKAAFPPTIPVMTGYLFMGSAFGILLQSQGYGWPWALLMAVTMYAGSGQFVGVGILTSAYNPLNAVIITLMVNARHVFYGFSMLDRFKAFGRVKPFLVFGLTDETFSLHCSVTPPPGLPQRRFWLALTELDHLYWVTGCTAGALLGSQLTFDPRGIDFVMTALFVAIVTEQLRDRRNAWPAAIGLVCPALCLALLGPDNFMLPAMAAVAGCLTLLRRKLEVWA